MRSLPHGLRPLLSQHSGFTSPQSLVKGSAPFTSRSEGLGGVSQEMEWRVGAGQSPSQVPGNAMPMKSLLSWPLSSLCLRVVSVSLRQVCVCERGGRDTHKTHTLCCLSMCGVSTFCEWENICWCDFSIRKSNTYPEGRLARKAGLSSLCPVHISSSCPSLLFMGSRAWLGALVPRSHESCLRSKPVGSVGLCK